MSPRPCPLRLGRATPCASLGVGGCSRSTAKNSWAARRRMGSSSWRRSPVGTPSKEHRCARCRRRRMIWSSSTSGSAAVAIGRTRTMQQDVSYGLRQLADVALKALSPGINDPTTAQDAIFHAAAVLAELLQRDPPARVHSGADGRRLVLVQQPTHDDLVRLAFDEVRRAGRVPTDRRRLRSRGPLPAEGVGDLEGARGTQRCARRRGPPRRRRLRGGRSPRRRRPTRAQHLRQEVPAVRQLRWRSRPVSTPPDSHNDRPDETLDGDHHHKHSTRRGDEPLNPQTTP